jgi:hypothetical protein
MSIRVSSLYVRNRTDLEPRTSRPRSNRSLVVQQNELFPRRGLCCQKKFLCKARVVSASQWKSPTIIALTIFANGRVVSHTYIEMSVTQYHRKLG